MLIANLKGERGEKRIGGVGYSTHTLSTVFSFSGQMILADMKCVEL